MPRERAFCESGRIGQSSYTLAISWRVELKLSNIGLNRFRRKAVAVIGAIRLLVTLAARVSIQFGVQRGLNRDLCEPLLEFSQILFRFDILRRCLGDFLQFFSFYVCLSYLISGR